MLSSLPPDRHRQVRIANHTLHGPILRSKLGLVQGPSSSVFPSGLPTLGASTQSAARCCRPKTRAAALLADLPIVSSSVFPAYIFFEPIIPGSLGFFIITLQRVSTVHHFCGFYFFLFFWRGLLHNLFLSRLCLSEPHLIEHRPISRSAISLV